MIKIIIGQIGNGMSLINTFLAYHSNRFKEISEYGKKRT
jgi:hypothetical protein